MMDKVSSNRTARPGYGLSGLPLGICKAVTEILTALSCAILPSGPAYSAGTSTRWTSSAAVPACSAGRSPSPERIKLAQRLANGGHADAAALRRLLRLFASRFPGTGNDSGWRNWARNWSMTAA